MLAQANQAVIDNLPSSDDESMDLSGREINEIFHFLERNPDVAPGQVAQIFSQKLNKPITTQIVFRIANKGKIFSP